MVVVLNILQHKLDKYTLINCNEHKSYPQWWLQHNTAQIRQIHIKKIMINVNHIHRVGCPQNKWPACTTDQRPGRVHDVSMCFLFAATETQTKRQTETDTYA